MFKAEKRDQVRRAKKIGRDDLGQRAIYSLEIWDSFETNEYHGPQMCVCTYTQSLHNSPGLQTHKSPSMDSRILSNNGDNIMLTMCQALVYTLHTNSHLIFRAALRVRRIC